MIFLGIMSGPYILGALAVSSDVFQKFVGEWSPLQENQGIRYGRHWKHLRTEDGEGRSLVYNV